MTTPQPPREEAEVFFYLTTTGHRTGQPHTIEIWFVERGGCYYLVAEHRERAHWVRNLRGDPRVAFHVGKDTPPVPGRARVVTPEADAALHAEVSALMDAKYEWSDGLIVEIAPA